MSVIGKGLVSWHTYAIYIAIYNIAIASWHSSSCISSEKEIGNFYNIFTGLKIKG